MTANKLSPAFRMPVRTALAAAIAMGFGFSGQVQAQATTGTISGQVPVAAGESVHIVGGSGFDRTVPVDQSGRYTITLPIGKYDVSLVRDGQTIQTMQGVTALAASAVTVDFGTGESTAANAKSLSGVTVIANAIPAIDVASTTQSTVITQEQLRQLPLARNSAAIALLAPGVVPGATADGAGPTGEPLVSFGGSTVVENAYYINGFNTSDPISNSGGITLPYGAIAQQETLTNGYGPEYGRSTGGVISQVGASGTNTWHFGGAVFLQPEDWQGTPGNTYYSNPAVTPALAASNSAYAGKTPGSLYDYRNDNTSWNQVYDAYIGGPLIKDKLFFFLAAEASRSATQTVSRDVGTPYEYHNNFKDPKYYGKIDWNITDSNILSFTGVKNTHAFNGDTYSYDYSTKQAGDFNSYQQSYKNSFKLGVANFTSYITDDLTLNAMYGKMKGTYYSELPGASSEPAILDSDFQNPAYCPSANCTSGQTTTYLDNPNHKTEETNLRLSLTYKLGDHTLKAGIDNQTSKDIEDGTVTSGPGYYWDYGYMDPSNPILGTPGVSPYVAASPNGYYVQQGVYLTSATVQVKQRAQYISDDWQVTPNLLLKLGLRNDQFTNYNPDSEPYVRLTKPQWAPRLGFSWDIMGDSSMKLFGNAGRYYLALPTGVALREASASTYTGQYYTYTGIDANGIPTGLTPIQSYGQTQGAGVPVSGNNEYGQPLDPSTVSSTNLKASYQDSYVLGFQQQISQYWTYGVTATWSKMNNIIDDTAEGLTTICSAALAQNPGLANQQPGSAAAAENVNCGNVLNVNGSILINPGKTNIYKIANVNGGYAYASVDPSTMGFPPAYRHYYSLEMYLEHVWDGKWRAKFDYVFSKSYGTTEGPVQSNIGQASTSQSATEQWDFGQLMSYANSVQSNSRKHVFKAYGTYQFLPEWSLSGVVTLAAGTPKTCLGLYGPDQQDPVGYGDSYHWCGGQPAPIGTTGYTPWLHTLDLALEYRPEWAAKKLAFQLQVRNVFNEQKETQAYAFYGSTSSPNPSYGAPYVGGYTTMETPRVVQLGVTYDW